MVTHISLLSEWWSQPSPGLWRTTCVHRCTSDQTEEIRFRSPRYLFQELIERSLPPPFPSPRVTLEFQLARSEEGRVSLNQRSPRTKIKEILDVRPIHFPPDSRSMGSRTTFTRFSLLALSSLLNGFLSFVSIDGGDNCLVFLPACIETVSRAPRYYMEWRVYLVLATKKKKKVQSPLAGNCQFILRRRNDATRLHRDLYTFDCAARGCPIRDFEKFLVKA